MTSTKESKLSRTLLIKSLFATWASGIAASPLEQVLITSALCSKYFNRTLNTMPVPSHLKEIYQEMVHQGELVDMLKKAVTDVYTTSLEVELVHALLNVKFGTIDRCAIFADPKNQEIRLDYSKLFDTTVVTRDFFRKFCVRNRLDIDYSHDLSISEFIDFYGENPFEYGLNTKVIGNLVMELLGPNYPPSLLLVNNYRKNHTLADVTLYMLLSAMFGLLATPVSLQCDFNLELKLSDSAFETVIKTLDIYLKSDIALKKKSKLEEETVKGSTTPTPEQVEHFAFEYLSNSNPYAEGIEKLLSDNGYLKTGLAVLSPTSPVDISRLSIGLRIFQFLGSKGLGIEDMLLVSSELSERVAALGKSIEVAAIREKHLKEKETRLKPITSEAEEEEDKLKLRKNKKKSTNNNNDDDDAPRKPLPTPGETSHGPGKGDFKR